MSSEDFEVLPVGSLNELITIRKLIAELITACSNDDRDGFTRVIRQMSDFYTQDVAERGPIA